MCEHWLGLSMSTAKSRTMRKLTWKGECASPFFLTDNPVPRQIISQMPPRRPVPGPGLHLKIMRGVFIDLHFMTSDKSLCTLYSFIQKCALYRLWHKCRYKVGFILHILDCFCRYYDIKCASGSLRDDWFCWAFLCCQQIDWQCEQNCLQYMP